MLIRGLLFCSYVYMMYIVYMKNEKTIRKNIDLTEKCVKALSKEAIDKNTVFKLYVQSILEETAKKLIIKN